MDGHIHLCLCARQVVAVNEGEGDSVVKAL